MNNSKSESDQGEGSFSGVFDLSIEDVDHILGDSFQYITVINRDGLIKYINKSGGIPRKELINKPIWNFISEEFLEKSRSAINSVFEKRIKQEYQTVMVDLSGKKTWLSNVVKPFVSSDGEFCATIVSTEIRSLKATGDIDLRIEKCKLIASGIPDKVFMLDKNGAIQFANKPFSDMSEDDVLDTCYFDYLPLEFRDLARFAVAQVFSTGNDQKFETLASGNEGDLRWYRCRVGAAVKNGDVEYVVLTARDVMEERGVRQALYKSEHEYRVLVEQAPIGIMTVDENGNILNANKRVIAFAGRKSLKDFQTVNVLTVPSLKAAGVSAALQKSIKNKLPVSFSGSIVTMAGDTVHTRISINPIVETISDTAKYLCIVEDISSQKNAEQKLFDLYRHLGVLNRKISIISSINTPGHEAEFQEVADSVLNSALSVADADLALYWSFDAVTEKFKLITSKGISDEYAQGVKDLSPHSHSFLERIIEEKIRFQGLVEEQGLGDSEVAVKEGVHSFLALPLVYNEKELVGLIFVGFKNDRVLSSQELQLYELFAMQATVALLPGKNLN